MIPLPGDWAARPMFRVTLPNGKSAIHIQATPDDDPNAIDGHKIAPVVKILTFLRDKNIRVPEIYEADPYKGILVQEDFGDGNWERLLPQDEEKFYTQAVDTLRRINAIAYDPAPDIPDFANSYIYRRTVWYLSEYKKNGDPAQQQEFQHIWDALIDRLPKPDRFVHGDYKAGNLMRLADGGMGVIDVGGAFWGSGVYDLVNLLEDIRREIDEDRKAQVKQAYGPFDEEAYAILHAQFYTRVLGQMTKRGMGIPPRFQSTLENLVHRFGVLAPLKTLVIA